MNFDRIPFTVAYFQFLVGTENLADLVELDIGRNLLIDITSGGEFFRALPNPRRNRVTRGRRELHAKPEYGGQ